ncbi:MAG: tetratricopeptide repeat protein [Alphaproteobacteria bacterium]|nr:tetratricopeptide repeat protein [Alphaproteobacteria bacterium]
MALARYYTRKKDFATAEGYYQREVDANPGNIRARVEFSEFFILQKKLVRASAVAQQIIQDYPDRAVGYEASGNIYLMENDAASAVGRFERMAAILGKNAGAYQLLGRAQLRNHDAAAASSSFLKALSLAKNKMPVIIDLVGLEAAQKNYGKAQKYIDQLKQTNKKNPVVYIIQGRLFGRENKPAKSLASYIEARKLGARGSRFTLELSGAYIKDNQSGKAVKVMAAWLKKNPKDLAVHHLLAGHYLKVKNYAKATKQYEIILAMKAKNPVALNNIAWLYSQAGQKKKALAAAQQAYKLFPNAAPFIDTYAWILVQQGHNKKGLELLQKAVTAAPEMTEIRYHLAVALNNAGKKAVARQELTTVISSGNSFPGLENARKLLKELSR